MSICWPGGITNNSRKPCNLYIFFLKLTHQKKKVFSFHQLLILGSRFSRKLRDLFIYIYIYSGGGGGGGINFEEPRHAIKCMDPSNQLSSITTQEYSFSFSFFLPTLCFDLLNSTYRTLTKFDQSF